MALWGFPCNWLFVFSLAAFRLLSLSFTFAILIMICLRFGLFGFILFGNLSASCTRIAVSFFRFGKFSAIISLKTFFFLILFIYLFIYLWLRWVFVSVQGLSLVAASGGHSSSRCAGLSLSRPLLLRSTGSRHADSVIVAHGPSCSTACGIFPDQGSNLCPLHWQADSQPLRHQGSPSLKTFLIPLSLSFFPGIPIMRR